MMTAYSALVIALAAGATIAPGSLLASIRTKIIRTEQRPAAMRTSQVDKNTGKDNKRLEPTLDFVEVRDNAQRTFTARAVKNRVSVNSDGVVVTAVTEQSKKRRTRGVESTAGEIRMRLTGSNPRAVVAANEGLCSPGISGYPEIAV